MLVYCQPSVVLKKGQIQPSGINIFWVNLTQRLGSSLFNPLLG